MPNTKRLCCRRGYSATSVSWGLLARPPNEIIRAFRYSTGQLPSRKTRDLFAATQRPQPAENLSRQLGGTERRDSVSPCALSIPPCHAPPGCKFLFTWREVGGRRFGGGGCITASSAPLPTASIPAFLHTFMPTGVCKPPPGPPFPACAAQALAPPVLVNGK